MAPQFINDTIRIAKKGSVFEPELIHKLNHKIYETELLLFYAEDMWLSEVKYLSSGHTLFDIIWKLFNRLFIC
jgi:hypothetical protein